MRGSSSLVVVLVLLLAGCASLVDVPGGVVLNDQSPHQLQRIKYQHHIDYQSINGTAIDMPKVGEKNAYGVIVTPELKLAYAAYLGGDGEAAITALEKAEQLSSDHKFLWNVSFLKVKIYHMMGLSADALSEVERTIRLEVAYHATNLNSIALRGEVKVWLGDYDGAQKDFSAVLMAVGAWELPTSYAGPPLNIYELISITTAQLRSYTGMAALYVLQGDFQAAFYWAEEAEKRYNALHYVANHPLYGRYVRFHLDNYYGRAMNLTFLASALTALNVDNPRANMLYEEALKFFALIQYAKGKATVLAFRAMAYRSSGQYELANKVALQALDVSIHRGMLDFVWRIETLRADVLQQQGQQMEAEKAYRRAFSTLNFISGSLKNDVSKRLFGVGKSDISYHLLQFDLQNNKLNTLFDDMERSRARAFVDILANRSIQHARNPDLEKIKKLDHHIMRQRLLNSARGNIDAGGVYKVKALLNQREKLAKQLQRKNPELASVVSIWNASLEKVKQRLKNGEAMVYFLPLHGDETMQFLYITADSVVVKFLAVSENEMNKLLGDLRNALGYSASNSALDRGVSIVKVGKRLDKQKLKNSIDQLKKALSFGAGNLQKLYVVPYASLNFVPWALMDHGYAISVLPNGSWLNIQKEPINSQKAVIVGDPDFAGQLPQLRGAREEADLLAKAYQTKALTFDDATPEHVRSAIGQGVAVLHLATHAVFYKDAPLDSALFLAGDGVPYALTAADLFDSPLRADLVVLSACETGIGESQGDSDFLGLSRSFYLGGSRAILNTLWPVDDEGTKVFMLKFHQYAKQGKYGQGWLAARDFLKSHAYSPAVYGAFVLNGVDR